MFTDEGTNEYLKYEKYISDDNFQFSPSFVPKKDTPKEAVEYYKDMYRDFFGIDFESPDFRWPVGIGLNC